ncbi:MAG TPA: O-antigen ligase family protein [Anaerolineales bacterium]|nr:O-antigen ligase family protein [Anaerolineales bacterium]
MGGETLVRPLSVYPLILLLVLAILPRLFKKRLPVTLLPWLAFLVMAFMSSVVALSLGTQATQGITVASRLLRNIFALGLGSAIYLTVALLPESWDDLNASLRWLYSGFGIALLWGSLQAVYIIHFSRPYFNWVSDIQTYLSTRKLFTTRVSGLTYEPKWFAEQICFLLLPWLVGAVLQNRSVFKWRYRRLTVELVLLTWSVIVLIFTFSRSGLVILGVVIVVSLFLFDPRGGGEVVVSGGKHATKQVGRLTQTILALVVIGLAVFLAGNQNRFFSRLWRYWTEGEIQNKTFLEYIGLRSRLAYVETAWRTFEAFPVFGVGLGNYALYFDEMLPDQPWSRNPEIIRLITPSDDTIRLITPKNLYARLLAETGLLGTIAFTAFFVAVLGCVLFLWLSSGPDQKFWGFSGLLSLIIFFLVMVSFDSFAIPNMWVVFGLITAAAHIPQDRA